MLTKAKCIDYIVNVSFDGTIRHVKPYDVEAQQKQVRRSSYNGVVNNYVKYRYGTNNYYFLVDDRENGLVSKGKLVEWNTII